MYCSRAKPADSPPPSFSHTLMYTCVQFVCSSTCVSHSPLPLDHILYPSLYSCDTMPPKQDNVQKLLAAEEKRNKVIADAKARKQQKVKQAKADAEREVSAFRAEKDREHEAYHAQQRAAAAAENAELARQTDVELAELKKLTDNRMNKVAEMMTGLIVSVKE
ncbi:V-type H+-transporting ATPase subunit G [Strigomonas culicis]|uniref:V-type H+-transporting ATPase subunit G n=1 Tax=Strigomonas culicis TaxID=28005 RepID=S9UK30_9TRYP|nr:V-type H+-transporting ATPase subunit G [Strigomonas culicis]|eukprot:EPY31172.1 V-type H+-transporting ATPase subunit G [Strigomonas culicis]